MTTMQLDFFTAPLIAPSYDKSETIQERFEKFNAANPWVLDALTLLAQQAKSRGRKRIGIKHLVEVIRWNYSGATVGDEFRLNNSHTSRYVRLIVKNHPYLADMFAFRELRAA